MDVSQSNENELQKAIDDITNGATAQQAGASNEVTSELEARIQGQMGTPPAPEMPAGGAMPDGASAPEGVGEPEGVPMPEMPTNAVEAMNPSSGPTIVGSAGAVGGEVPEAGVAPEAEVEGASAAGTTEAANGAGVAELANGTAGPETNGDLHAVKQAMLRDLYPLMDKVPLTAEQKFDIYKEMIESTGDTEMIPAAYEVVKSIADEAARAEALLYLVDKA